MSNFGEVAVKKQIARPFVAKYSGNETETDVKQKSQNFKEEK